MKIYSLRGGARNYEEFFNTALTKALNYLLILTALSLFAAFMLRNFWVFLGDGGTILTISISSYSLSPVLVSVIWPSLS